MPENVINNIFIMSPALAHICLRKNIFPELTILNKMVVTLSMNYVLKILIDKCYKISINTIISAITNYNSYALEHLMHNQMCELKEKTSEPLTSAIKSQNFSAVNYLLENEWPLPDIQTLVTIINTHFNQEIFEVLFDYFKKNKKISTSDKDSLKLEQLSELVIKYGLTEVITMFVSQPGSVYPKNEWISSLTKRGMVDLVEFINKL